MNNAPPDALAAFGIGPDDIAANREGRLSPRQAKQIAASGTRNLAGALFAGVILALILAFVVNHPLKPAQPITAGILFLAILAVGIHDFRRTRAAAKGPIERISGPIEITARGTQGWFISVAGREFRMPVQPWKLQNGTVYHVYFSPRANRIVAMEPAS